MFQRASFGAVVLSVSLSACGGSTASNAPAASEPAGSEPATSAAPAEAEPPAAGSSDAASSEAVSEAVSEATRVAEAWLKLVDEGQYDASWTNAASVFRGALTSEAWSKAVGGVRGQLGKVLSRKLASANFTTSVPGAPDGKYVIIQLDTSFENKASAVETVSPMLDTDGVWRVAGYFVR